MVAGTSDRRAAADARGKGDRVRAQKLLRDALVKAPDDHEVHGRLAQLLAEDGDVAAASKSFRAGAEGYHARGFTDRAVALLKQAVQHAPSDAAAWLRIAELLVIRKKVKDAVKVLSDARAHFKKKSALQHAGAILDARLRLEPHRVDVAIDRARVAKRLGHKTYGVLLLTDLCDLVDDTREQRALRRALFALEPTPRSLWRWLKAPRAAVAVGG